MAGAKTEDLILSFFPKSSEKHLQDVRLMQLKGVFRDFHIEQSDFANALEALKVNHGSIEGLSDALVTELKKMFTKEIAKGRNDKENRKVTEFVPRPRAESAFSKRTDKGEVVAMLPGPGIPAVRSPNPIVEILTPEPSGYFYNLKKTNVTNMGNRLSSFKTMFQELYEVEVEDRLTRISESHVTVVGRVVSEDGGKLSAATLMMEDAIGRVELDVSNVPSFMLYPGKIIAAVGSCNGLKFLADHLLDSVPSPYQIAEESSRSVNMAVACGPFTTTENMEFEPLQELLRQLGSEQCDCLVLCGPFFDCEHPLLKTELSPPSAYLQSSEYTYEEALNTIIRKVADGLKPSIESLPKCQILVVPSTQDLANMYPVPQKPYITASLPSNVRLLPNPASIRINGVLLNMSSLDMVKEISTGSFNRTIHQVNKIELAFNEMLEQRTFLPFFPGEVPVDLGHLERLHFPASPDLLISCSKMMQTAAVIRETVCINPGTLARGVGGGSFARVFINDLPGPIHERTQVQVVRI